MSAVDKLLLAAQGPRTTLMQDPAGDLVLAAVTAVGEIRALLAGDDGDDDDQGADSHSGHATYKALRKKGMNDARAARMCAQADKRAKTSALADAAAVALAGLAVPGHDLAAAVRGTGSLLGAAGGDYADPGLRDGRARLPLGTEEKVRLSLAVLAVDDSGYAPHQLAAVRDRAEAAAARHGIAWAADEGRHVAALLELAVLDAEARDRQKDAGHTIAGTGDYPIPDKAHLSAAVARYKQGKFAGHSKESVAAHIRKHARRLGEEVDLAAGSGLDEAAEALVLARRQAPPGHGGVVMEHAPFTGLHSHNHFQSSAHDHPHQHFGDNEHGPGPVHQVPRPGGGRHG